jgi:hypothetical protein
MPVTSALLALLVASTPAAAAQQAPDAPAVVADDTAPDALVDEADEHELAATTATPNQDAIQRYRIIVVAEGLTLVDSWSSDGVGQQLELLGGMSLLTDWVRVLGGVSASRGPATPSYCTGCSGTPIPVHPSLQTVGLTLGLETIVPLGPIRPFLGMRQSIAVATAQAAPFGPSLLISLSPRAGVELPLPAGFAARLSTGVQIDTHRWMLGESFPLPGSAGRQSPEVLRFAFGLGLSKRF